MRRKITKTAVEALEPNSTIWDTELKGFGARRKAGDVVTFIVKTRVKGRQRWLTIGKFGKLWTAEKARLEAHDILGKSYKDIDVAVEKEQARRRGKALENVLGEYLATHVALLKPQTRSSYIRIVRQRLIPALGRKEPGEVRAEDVLRLHRSLAETPRLANLTVNVLAAALSWAAERGYCDPGHLPCSTVKRYRENKRKRPLSGEEAIRLASVLREAAATGEVSPLVLLQIWLVIFTGARRGEISNLRWADIDTTRRILTLPDSKTGPKTIVLGELAIDILAMVPRMGDSAYVFPNGAGKPLDSYWKLWNQLRHRAGIADVRMHDLRHSFGTVAVSAGASLPVLSRIFGHSDTRMTEGYAHVEDAAASHLAEATTRLIADRMGSPFRKSTRAEDQEYWSG